ncbi:hypothetical protein I4U23_004105 [Adineta vaga]|nr:hypothetical protein I4U23_004105 [Adineta vaga]
MRLTFLTVFYLCLLPIFTKSLTIISSSNCKVDQCTLNNPNGNCSAANTCYRFETSKNKTVCAPQANCSLFDVCTAAKTCASNNSVCVINSCCAAPICMPIALTSVCSSTNANGISNSQLRVVDGICPTAIWSDIEQIAVNFSNISSYYFNYYTSDFYLDAKNNYITIDNNNRRIIKIEANETSAATYSVIGAPNTTIITYSANKLYVDSNGTVYAAESGYGSGIFGYSTYYRVVKYVEGNGTDGTVVFGEVICGNQMNQLCQCGGLFVDSQGFIYYSDPSNHRVVKITQNAMTLILVAGTNGISGSMTNQLNTPGGIYLDQNNTLYIADTNNYRVVMYPSGSAYGTVLFTVKSQYIPYHLTLDKYGNIYILSSNYIYRYGSTPASAFIKSIVYSATSSFSGMYGYSSIRLDTAGNIYTLNSASMYSIDGIWKYSLISTGC